MRIGKELKKAKPGNLQMRTLFCGEEAEPAKTILTDELTRAPVIDIDKHIFFRMAGKKAGKNLYEVFLGVLVGSHESVTDIQSMRPLTAVESGPEASTVNAGLIQHPTELPDLGFDLLEIDGLRVGKRRKQKCGCQEDSI